MNAFGRYNYFYKDRNITITIWRKSSNDESAYLAKSDYKNISAMAECWEKALENCVKRIKFAFSLLEKEVCLIDQNQAVILAKRYFEKCNYKLFKRFEDRLSYSVFIEDETMTLDVLISEENISLKDRSLTIIAVVYVDMITGECDVVECSREESSF